MQRIADALSFRRVPVFLRRAPVFLRRAPVRLRRAPATAPFAGRSCAAAITFALAVAATGCAPFPAQQYEAPAGKGRQQEGLLGSLFNVQQHQSAEARLKQLAGVRLSKIYAVFGRPDLRLREGELWRLQFRSGDCILTIIARSLAHGGERAGADTVINAYAVKQLPIVAGITALGYNENDKIIRKFCAQ